MDWLSEMFRFGPATQVVVADTAAPTIATDEQTSAAFVRLVGATTVPRDVRFAPRKAGATWLARNECPFAVNVGGPAGALVPLVPDAVRILAWDGSKMAAVADTLSGIVQVVNPTTTTADAARIQAACTAMSQVGGEVLLGPGTFAVNAVIAVPTNVRIRGCGVGVTRIVSSIAATPATNCVFFMQPAYGASGTLAATPTLYSSTITSTTDMAVGTWVRLDRAAPTLHCGLYKIVAKSGSGTFTYTLDRPLVHPFQSGGLLRPVTGPIENVEISHMTITGTGVRAIDCLATVRTYVHDVLIDTTGGNLTEGASFDTCNLDGVFERVTVVGAGALGYGLLVESSDRCTIRDCRASGCTTTGFVLWDSVESGVVDSKADGCACGVLVGGDNVFTTGCADSWVSGGAFVGGNYGVQVGISQRTRVVGASCRENGTAGIIVQGQDATAAGVAVDVVLSGNTIVDANITAQSASYGGIFLKWVSGCAMNGNNINGAYGAGVLTDAVVTGLSGNVGRVSNVVAGSSGRRDGFRVGVAGCEGRIVGMVVDTAQYGVRIDAASICRDFYVDNMGTLNLASSRVVSPDLAVIDGVLYKTDAATTVDVHGRIRTVRCADTGACTVTNFTNADDLQEISVEATNANTTFNRTNAALAGSANWVSAQYSTLRLIYRANLSLWTEQSRATTNG